MNEEELEAKFSKIKIPPPSDKARENAADAAWAKLQHSQKPRQSATKRLFGMPTYRFSRNMAIACSLLLVTFSGLSYLVSSSTRSGGRASSETTLISTARITQYPATISTSVMRMLISNKDLTLADINFDKPPQNTKNLGTLVFSSQGGNSTYISAPADIMANNQPGEWYFNMNFEVADLGSNVPNSIEGNEIIAFLPNIKASICSKINIEYGLGKKITTLSSDLSALYKDNKTQFSPLPKTETILGEAGTKMLAGQPFGCFQNGNGEYVYYHVLIEN